MPRVGLVVIGTRGDVAPHVVLGRELQRAGAEVRLVGRVGTDSLGDAALAGPKAAGVDTRGVRAVDTPTGCATIWVDAAGENRIVVASGANAEVRADDVDDDLLGDRH